MANPHYWYARHFKDYAAKTAHLSLAEHGAYSMLLDHYYQAGGKVIANAMNLLRVCRCQTDDERAAVQSILSQFFYVGDDGMYHNHRADKEMGITANVSAARSAAGKAGAAKRWGEGKQMASGIANAMANGKQDTSQIDAQPQPQQQPQGTSKTTPIPPKGAKAAAKEKAIGLQAYISECKAAGRKPIPADDAVFEYAASAKIPDDFLLLQWKEFSERYKQPGQKRYKDWRAVFNKSVRGNWFRLWYIDSNGDYLLTTQGIQAQNRHKKRAA